MHIGLTYDLRCQYLAEGYSLEETAEMDQLDTINALDGALVSLGHQVDRVGHVRHLVDKLAAGQRWDLVFNICEGLTGFSRESQVPAILDAYHVPYTFSDPLTSALCLHKAMAKSVMRSRGVPTADHQVAESVDDIDRMKIGFPAFVKPVGEGTGKGISPASKVTNQFELHRVCKDLLQRFAQPVIIEPFLPGREFTVSILGQASRARVLGTLEIVLLAEAEPEVYSYTNKERCEELVEYRQVTSAQSVVAIAETNALAAWRALGCRDAGRVDLRCDVHGDPLVMEINPIAGMHPTHSDLPMTASAIGMNYRDLVAAIVSETCWRTMQSSPEPRQLRPARPHFMSDSAVHSAAMK